MKRSKTVAVCAVLTALAAALSWIERFLTPLIPIPLPGLRLGLANIAVITALYALGPMPAALVAAGKCMISLVFSGPTAFLFSLCGSALSLLGMWTLTRFPRAFSRCGVSTAGAALHNTGQIAIAAVFMRTGAVWSYLSWLLPVSLLTGPLTALLSGFVLQALQHYDPVKKQENG